MSWQPTVGTTAKPTRPILRYHGSKWKLAPWIISFFPEHRVYVEPYGGGASVLLRKERSYAEVYNDLDGEIVNLFRVLRDRGKQLRDKIALTPFSREEYRRSFVRSSNPIEQARRTLVRSFMGFGSNALARHVKSGFRSNSNRSGTTPAHDWHNLPGPHTGFKIYTGNNRHQCHAADWKAHPGPLEVIAERLSGVVIEREDAARVIRQHDQAEAVFYCDPPYPRSTRSLAMHGDHGYTHEMNDDQHRELAQVLRSVKGMVILSGYPCDLYDKELYPGWHRFTKQHLADGARKRTEVLWLNQAAYQNMPQKRLL